jgi:FkbM family methyltransferase
MRVQLALRTRPALPILRDSLRLQRSPYAVALRDGSLRFELEPRGGDWYTFYECCIRRDYLRPPVVLRPGDTVLDIGGNFGAFALAAARLVGPTGRVRCYEPARSSVDRIERHIALNGASNVVAVHAAVGGSSGRLPLFLSPRSAFNSLHVSVDGRVGQGEGGVELVEVIGIGDVLAQASGPIALAKIDCEGSEYDIFDALSDEALAAIAQFAIETHAVPGRSRAEITARLIRLGYTIKGRNPVLAVRRWRQAGRDGAAADTMASAPSPPPP